MPGYDEKAYLKILRDNWGYSDFRGIQRDIIRSIADGNDTLGLMPTGGGKSLTFQVPALAKEGVCIVITPLIALMKDQVMALRRRGIIAAAIYSGMTRNETVATLDNCIMGNTKILYVSPERLSSEFFKVKLRRINVSFITVDEAHCISQWGYDFRPSYLHIADIRRLKPDAPVLALTATATSQVIADIQERLAFRKECVFRMSFERKNLSYIVRQTMNKPEEMLHILNSVEGSAIVYVRSRDRSKEVSQFLEEHDISATFYHAGLENAVKDDRQRMWTAGQKRVMVATNAFGMGIDKPDVRLVIHIDCPSSVETYFQEAGRAGRDGNRSYAVLLYNSADHRKLERRIDNEYPPKQLISDIYEHVAYFFEVGTGCGGGHIFTFDVEKFCRAFHHFPLTVDSALRILSNAGYFDYDPDPDTKARLRFTLDRDQLYRLTDLSHIEDTVIMALLRNYSGLFVDYVFIDESYIASKAGLTSQQVYLVLKGLSMRRIVHFVPQRRMPTITYLVNRVETERLFIPSSVYEERKAQFEKSIMAMVSYATNSEVCRSRQLLRYFDEEKTTDCGCCDVCNNRKTTATKESHNSQAKTAILAFLADRKSHAAATLLTLGIPREVLGEALESLIAEDAICVEDGNVMLS
jgi:ATP-dependent DNA helicase RecQ